jgi:hypothetical protein
MYSSTVEYFFIFGLIVARAYRVLVGGIGARWQSLETVPMSYCVGGERRFRVRAR